MASKRWAGTTFGSGWMHKWLIRLLAFIDVRFFYLFAAIFIVPVCLLFCNSRRTSWRFYRVVMGYPHLKAAWAVYANHYNFAQAVIDKFAMYAGRRFEVTVDGLENFDRLAAGEEGFVQLSSHIGNYEIAGYSLVSDRKTINAVVYEGEKASVMQNRTSMFDRTNIRMILLRSDMSHLFEIDKALSGGDIVSFPTDRYMGGRTVECRFLGRSAKFPQGPFSAAAMRGLSVLAVNVMKTGAKHYNIYVTPLEYDTSAPRKEQIACICGAYVSELEKRVMQYPLQWFNFFDFWA